MSNRKPDQRVSGARGLKASAIARERIMMSKRISVLWVTGLIVLGGAGASAETIESVEKAINENSKKIKSLTANTRTVAEMESAGYKSKTVSEGRFEMLRQGDKVLTRIESKDSSTVDMNGKVEKTDSKTLVITDGEFGYSCIETGGQKTAYKMKCPQNWEVNPFEVLRKTNDLELLPEEKIDGVEVYVVKATPKKTSSETVSGKMVQYYRKDNGFPMKIVTFTPTGKPMSTMTYSDLKTDVSVSRDRFVFKAPEGVQVMDMTKMSDPAAPSEQSPATNKREEPRKEEPNKSNQPAKKQLPKLPKIPKLPG